MDVVNHAAAFTLATSNEAARSKFNAVHVAAHNAIIVAHFAATSSIVAPAENALHTLDFAVKAAAAMNAFHDLTPACAIVNAANLATIVDSVRPDVAMLEVGHSAEQVAANGLWREASPNWVENA